MPGTWCTHCSDYAYPDDAPESDCVDLDCPMVSPDDGLGAAWWNHLSKSERARWSEIAGNTGRAKDAWEAFKQGGKDDSG